jgi:hypothetical protein
MTNHTYTAVITSNSIIIQSKVLQDWYNDIIENFTPIENRGAYEKLDDKEKDKL